jgi:hypothetical protein
MSVFSWHRLALFLVSAAHISICVGATTDPSCFGSTIKPDVKCPGEQIDPAAAANDSSAYAWRVFAEINQPAFPGNQSDARRIWETWKSADDNTDPTDAIYLNDGSAPQPWGVKPRATATAKPLSPIRQLQLLEEQTNTMNNVVTPFFIPSNPLAEEVRTNRPAFNFIVQNGLFNQQGQYRYSSVNQSFDFPVGSKEVKAIWRELPAGVNAADYYHAASGGRTYILVAMHVITKDLPFWFWASFVHKDQDKDPGTAYVAPLVAEQPIPSVLKGTPFENYRLIQEQVQEPNGKLVPDGKGAQLDWVTRVGEGTVLGNPNIESGFEQQSSCINCHSHASIGRASNGSLAYNKIPLNVGVVNNGDFLVNGTVFYPLDFLWSLQNAKSSQSH